MHWYNWKSSKNDTGIRLGNVSDLSHATLLEHVEKYDKAKRIDPYISHNTEPKDLIASIHSLIWCGQRLNGDVSAIVLYDVV